MAAFGRIGTTPQNKGDVTGFDDVVKSRNVPRYVRGLDTELATTILSKYPTAAALRQASAKKLSMLRFAVDKRVGTALATALIAAAKASVGQRQHGVHELHIRYVCDDIVGCAKELVILSV